MNSYMFEKKPSHCDGSHLQAKFVPLLTSSPRFYDSSKYFEFYPNLPRIFSPDKAYA